MLVANLVFLDYLAWKNQKIGKKSEDKNQETNLPTLTQNKEETATSGAEPIDLNCFSGCQGLIDQRIEEALAKIPTQAASKTAIIAPTSSQLRVSYIPLMTESTINSADWKDITPSDFYFDLADYSRAGNVRLEVYLKSQYQSGRVYLRLYDLTNKRAVDYSDLSSSSEAFELQRSSDLSIWQGNNLYRLQGKTQSGIEGYLKEAKLKITF